MHRQAGLQDAPQFIGDTEPCGRFVIGCSGALSLRTYGSGLCWHMPSLPVIRIGSKHSTPSGWLHNLFELLDQHRIAFRQERSYWRVVGLVFGELFNFGRHTVTQGLMALGLTEADGSGWYRLFSHGRYAEPRVARIFFQEMLRHTSREEPYVVGVAGVQIPRSSLKLAGTS
jgi:hypothetical protein